MKTNGFIGVFDSGYGGLTVLGKVLSFLPQYNYLYLGDNARTPYGSRSSEIIHEFTLQAVKRLFEEGCHLVILACNTASSKALRIIQQKDLLNIDFRQQQKKVLGVIRPTIEAVGELTRTRHVGILGTEWTIFSNSYAIEIQKVFPDVIITGEACPMWVPLVENAEYDSLGADYFVQQHLYSILNKDPLIDALILACTHYPLLKNKIEKYLPTSVSLILQGDYVAKSLADYLSRHPEMDELCSKDGMVRFYTTESEKIFSDKASIFLKDVSSTIEVRRITLK